MADYLAVVPLIVEDVIVGKVLLDVDQNLTAEITAPGTQAYFKEMLLVHKVEGISIGINYAEPSQNHASSQGHLRLVREY